VHFIDDYALADALLARLPVRNPATWRVGHIEHIIPEGYLETLSSGRNRIKDENLAAYYDRLTLVTRGELWSLPRFVAIWKMNTGQYDRLIEAFYDEMK
jgi:arabinofuranosyltransferase